MAQLWPVLAGLVLLLGTNINLAGAGTCRPATCSQSGGNGIFKYQAGHTYVYNLEGKTLTDLPEQQGEAVKIELKAVAEVNFGEECTNTLKLRNVQITGPDAKTYGNLKELEAYAVRFSFNDGHVEPEICADADDSNTALNIKRAVISLFQVSTPQSTGSASKHEVDVFGGCATNFQFEVRGDETLIAKTRNLNKCSFREGLRNRVPTSTYATNSDYQSSPMLDSNLVVEQSVKNGVLHTAHSHETYLYRPFSNKDAGAKTVVHTILTFVSKGAAPAHRCNANAPKSIIFDSPHGDSTVQSSTASIVAAMHACKDSMPDNVKFSAATEFRHLVEVFRSSKKDDLLTVYGQVKAGAGFATSARKLYLDALFRAGTGDSVQVAVELLKSNELSGHVARLWYTSFAFVRHATPASLTAAASLLDTPGMPHEAYLGVGSLAGRYCGEHTCEGVAEYEQLLSKLAHPIAKGCKCTSYEQENNVIAALKGIENAKGMNEATAELLRICMSDLAAPARVRVAALEAARSDACQPQLKKTALELLTNTQEDSEIRIKAYLAAVECPCGKCANTVKTLLDTEPVNQVGSFIISHLRNIRASNNPDKAIQKHHMSEIRTSNKFPFDVRKFSRNFEFSGLLDAINVGSSAEANVIYSQQSYLPRSTSFNLTTEIFGHSINFLEIGTRAQNLDRLFESYFGPQGYANTHDAEEIFKTGKATIKGLKEKMADRFKKTFRSKRSVPTNKLEEFRKNIYQSNDGTAMDLDLSVKMFGSTLGHTSYRGDAHEFSSDKIIDKLFDLMDAGVKKAKSFNYDLKHHAIFYENEVVYPTSLGFPLKMTVSGSAAIHLKLDGKLDLQAIVKDPKNAHLQFEAVPSAAVEMIGMMSMDAYAVEAGLKLTGNLHTATGVNFNIKSVDGTGIDMTVGLPVKKQELINFKSEILTSVRERGQVASEHAMEFNTKRKEFNGCFDQLSAAVGLTFCGDVGMPFEGATTKAAFFPLNGPSRLLISVESDDVQAYRLKGIFNLKDEDHRSIEFLIDTPNSQNSRKVELLLEAKMKPNRELRVNFTSPIKSASAELIYVSNQRENSLVARAMNEDQEYYVKLGADVSGSEDHQTYTPMFEYRLPFQQERLVAKGKGKGKAQKQAVADYSIEGTVNMDRDGDSRKFTFNNIVVTIPAGGRMSLTGWVAHDKSSVSSDLKVLHGQDGTVTIKGKAEVLGERHFKVKGDLQASQYPDLGVSLDWDYHRQTNELESNLVLVHGQDLSSTQSCLTAHISAKYHCESNKDFAFSGEGQVTYPLMGVNAKIKGELMPKGVSYEVEGTYDTYSIKSDGHAKTGLKNPGDYDIEFEAKVLDSYVKFESNRDILSPHENKFHTKLEMKPGGTYEFTANTVCKLETNHMIHKIDVVVMTEGQPEPYKFDFGVDASSVAFNGHIKAGLGALDYVDIIAKVNKGANPSGSFKVLLKDHIDGAGEYSLDASQGSLNGHIKMLKLNRGIHVIGTLAITGTNRVGSLDISFDQTDPNKKIHFETVSDMKPNAADSKSTLIVFGYKTVLNFKGDLTGKLSDGHLKGSADLTLPNKRYYTGSIDRIVHMRPGDTEGTWKIEISRAEKQGAPARTLIVDAKAEKCNSQKGFFDIDFNLIYKNLQGKDVKYNVAGMHLPDGDKRHVEFQGQIQGSLVDMAPMIHVKADIVKPVINYWAKVNLADDSNLELTGMTQSGIDGTVPYLLENALELNLPTGELKNVKVVESWSLIKGEKGAPYELKGSVSATYNGANTVKVEADLKASQDSGQGKMTLSMPNDELRVFKGTYHVGKGPDTEREGSLTFIQGQKEGFVEMKVKIPQDKSSFHITMNGRTPMENIKTFGFVANSARKEKSVDADVVITVDDKKVEITSKYGLDWRSPVLEIGVVHPSGKSFLGFHFVKLVDAADHYEAEGKYEHDGESGYGKLDIHFPSVHEFEIKVDADSSILKIDKVHVEIANQPGVKGGKSITVSANEAGQPTVNGKLDYTFKDGSEGTLFEASGNLKVKGENRQAKIIVKKSVISSLSENGFEYSITTMLGDQTVESLFKQSTKEIHVLLKGCKSADACGLAEYCSKYSIEGTDFSNEVSVDFDVTGLGFTTDFALKRITQKQNKEFLHKVEYSSKNKELFSFKVEFNDKLSTICLITPTREMAVEAKYTLAFDPKNKQHITYRYEANAWLDKVREPAMKSTLLLDNDYLRTDDSVTMKSEAKFMHPSLGKDMVLKGSATLGGRQMLDTHVDIDVFAKKGQKIVIDGKVGKNVIANGYNFTSTWDIKSKGQNLDIIWESHAALSTNIMGCGSALIYKDQKGKRDLGFGYETTMNKATFFMKSPKDVLVDVSGTYQWNDRLPSAEFNFAIVGCKGVVGKAHFDEDNRFIYTIFKQETPNRKIQGEICLDFTKKASTSLDWVIDAEKKELYHFGVTLDNKVTPDVSYSLDNMKALIEYVREDLKVFVEKVKDVSKGLEAEAKEEFTDLADGFKKAQPNVKPMLTAYQTQLKALQSEIASDDSVKELTDFVKKFAGSASAIFGQVTELLAKIASKMLEIFEEFSNAVIGSLKRIMPKVTESWTKIFNAGIDIFNMIASQFLGGLKELIEMCKKHEEELKQIITAFAEIGRDIINAIGKTVSHIYKEIKDFTTVIVDQIKALPMFTMLQERIDDIKLQIQSFVVPDQIFVTIKDVTNGLKDTLPTQELRDFVECISGYFEKVLKKEKIDYPTEWRKIYLKGIAAVKSIVVLLKSELAGQDAPTAAMAGVAWPFSFSSFSKIPVWASIHLSPLEYIRSDDLPSLKEYFFTYLPRSWNPMDLIPPFKSYAAVVDSSHFFTFDNRHFTFKGTGSCSYILAQDATNGNFTLVLNLDKGKFKTMQLTDGKDTVEVTAQKTILWNGQPSEMPIQTNTMSVWRRYHSINLMALAGLQVQLNPDYHLTFVSLSGFYHGQVRGLLGDANHEQFDDFRLPDGNICTNPAEFGNAYQVGGSCTPGTSVEHSHGHEAECTALFTANSPLRPAFSFLEPDSFREACDHFVAETTNKKQEYACRIAAAYVKMAKKHGMIVEVPHVCASCESPSKPFGIGEVQTLKAPSQKSDIIIVLEQVTNNAEIYKELIVPLVASLTTDLNSKGISDVHFSLMGYGHPEQKWPSHHTTNGEIGFDGSVKLKFGDADKHPQEWGTTDDEKLAYITRKVNVELGLIKLTDAVLEAARYPFRAGASKVVLLVMGTPCEKGLPYGFQKLRFSIAQKIARDQGISIHVITPMEGFNIMGNKEAKLQKNVVGFDASTVYSTSDGKKKTIDGAGNEDLRKDIEYKQDICIEASQSTNGAAFNANNFIDSKGNQRKNFLQVVTNKLSHSLSTELTMECRCTLDKGMFAESRCKVTGRKESEQLVAQTETTKSKKGGGKKPKN